MTPRHLKGSALHTESRAISRDGVAADGQVKPGMKDWHLTIGDLVHACAGALAEYRMASPTELAGRAAEWATAAARDTRVLGKLSKARAQVGSLTCAYLQRWAPGPDAQFLGSEVSLGTRRVDLVWFVPDIGIVIDELKTTNSVKLALDPVMLAQPRDYARLGEAEWGDLFAGVRFLPLRNPHQAVMVTTSAVVPLTESALANLRGTGRAA